MVDSYTHELRCESIRPGLQEVANTLTRMFGDTYSLTSHKIPKLYVVAILQILGVDQVGNWLREIHNITVPLRDPSLFLQISMQQQGRENQRERETEIRQANRVELDTLEQLVSNHEKLTAEQQARLGVLQSARERVNENNETQRLKRHVKRQKRQEEAINQEHPMIKLLVNSGGNKCSPKLIQLVSNGTLKNVLMSYFVHRQTMKLSDKFLETVDGCKGVTRQLILNCLDHHIPDLSRMKVDISAKQPLSKDNSTRAQQIILQLFP